MTDPEMADEIYIEPLRADVIAKIIEKEKAGWRRRTTERNRRHSRGRTHSAAGA